MNKFVLAAVLTGALSGNAFAQTATPTPTTTSSATVSVTNSPTTAYALNVNVTGCPATGECVPQLKGTVIAPNNKSGPVTAYADRGSAISLTVLGVNYFVGLAFTKVTLNGIIQTYSSHQSLLGANCTIIANMENTIESVGTRINFSSKPVRFTEIACTK